MQYGRCEPRGAGIVRLAELEFDSHVACINGKTSGRLALAGFRQSPLRTDISHAPFARPEVITTFAGTAKSFSSLTSVLAVTAPVAPSRVAVGPNGAAYFGDREANLVFRLNPDGSLIVVAGNGIAGFSGDRGPATSASLNQPSGFAVDTEGNLYIADVLNARVRKVDTNGIITTYCR